ncbi:MAG: CoA transferase, partial [Pseudomonadota bacterium]
KSQSFVELIYETADGHMAVSAHTDSTWRGLSAAVGRPDWLDDPRFASVEAREVNKAARLELTQEALRTDTTETWMRRLTEQDVPCAPVLRRAEMIEHPQVQANGIVVERDHPQAGRLRQTRAAAVFEGFDLDEPLPARRLGEDTAAVLAQAGYTPEAIRKMLADGAAAEPQDLRSAAQ